MIDSEFRSQRTPLERRQALPFLNVGGSVLYHSLAESGSKRNRNLPILIFGTQSVQELAADGMTHNSTNTGSQTSLS
jgi:hypothetical protein